jgi:hypothetical protein
MISKSVRGVIRGRTIELETESGFAEGEKVDVVVRPIDAKPDTVAISAKAAQARDEIDWDEWDAIMREIYQARKIERRRSSEEE